MSSNPRLTRSLAPALLGLASLLATAPATALTSTPVQMTPDQVAQLYLDVIVHDNADSARQLNDYLRLSNDGKDTFDVNTVKNMAAIRSAQFQQMAAQLAGALPNARHPRVLKDKLAEALQLQHAAVQQSDCKVQSSKIKPNDLPPGYQVVQVTYQCTIPNVRYSFEAALSKLAAPDEAGVTTLVDEFLAALRHPKGVKTVTGKKDLFAPSSQGPWSTEDYNEWVDPIIAGFQP
jgi:hypothetical protein